VNGLIRAVGADGTGQSICLQRCTSRSRVRRNRPLLSPAWF